MPVITDDGRVLVTSKEAARLVGYRYEYFRILLNPLDRRYDPRLAQIRIQLTDPQELGLHHSVRNVFDAADLRAWMQQRRSRLDRTAHNRWRTAAPAAAATSTTEG